LPVPVSPRISTGRVAAPGAQVLAQLLRARVDEHQRLGTDAQRALVQLGKGQQRLAKRVEKS
jgi:hypothetical protein